MTILLLAGIYSLAGSTPTRASVVLIDYPVKAKGSDPFWRVQRKKLWGFMDRTGRIVIEPRFKYAGDFIGGLALACVPGPSSNDRLCGYINHAGEFVIQPRFRPAGEAFHFTDGVAAVRTDDGAVLIDRTGKILTARPFFYIHELSEGLASVRITKPGVDASVRRGDAVLERRGDGERSRLQEVGRDRQARTSLAAFRSDLGEPFRRWLRDRAK